MESSNYASPAKRKKDKGCVNTSSLLREEEEEKNGKEKEQKIKENTGIIITILKKKCVTRKVMAKHACMVGKCFIF